MICVTVSRPRHRFMLAECKGMADHGADLIELRLDALQTVPDVKLLLKDRPCPILITCRRQSDGGKCKMSEQDRMVLIRTAIFEGADYIDLEYDIAEKVPRYGKTKRVISYHNFECTPDNLDQLVDQMSKLDADYLKICTMANCQSDNVRVLNLIGKTSIPTIAFCMGPFGTPSRVLCGAYGAPWTYACADADSAAAPGQIPFDQMKNLYQYDYIKRTTPVFGVIADPVGHSMSPLIHNSAYADQEVDAVYLPFLVEPEQLETFINQDAPALNVKGLSVTIPHKVNVIPLLDVVDPAVSKIGACNTIVWKDGKRIGYNTDYQSAMDAISKIFGWKEPLKIVHSGNADQCEKQPLTGKIALILGAGGVAKAVATGLRLRGADLVITDIDVQRADDLAQKLGALSIPWAKRGEIGFDLAVNCTPVGMYPNSNASPFEPTKMPASTASKPMGAFDCVYNPEDTVFLKSAREKGWKTASGLDMFAGQAQLQYQLFLNQTAPAEVMRNAVREATTQARW